MKRVLITGAGGPAGINFTKSLRIAPEKLFLAGTEANPYYAKLALTDQQYVVPHARDEEYLDRLIGIIEAERIEFVHPQPDVEVLVISEHREALKAATFLPSRKAIRICQDKFQSSAIWRKRGLSTFEAIELRRESDVEKAFDKFGSPIWIRTKHGAGARGSTPSFDKENALSWIRYWQSRRENWEFIAQKYYGGRNLAFHSLWKNGELITSMARERVQYFYPHLAPSGITGTPSVQRTIHDRKVNKTGTEAVLAIDPNFSGIACVDLKEDERGTPCPTEINAGRMFTTSFFFSFAGKLLNHDYSGNLPYLYLKLAYKEQLPLLKEYNALPKDLYWIRHIDAPAKLVKGDDVLGEMYS